MNTANLQLEGLYLAIASLSSALVAKGVMSRDEVDAALRSAEETALSDYRAHELSSAHREAVAFPARLLRMANNGAGDGETQPFSELAKMVGELGEGAMVDSSSSDDGTVFYSSSNGDRWSLLTDSGGRRFVIHTGNRQSGGARSLTDLESFRERDPNSPQNEALEAMLSRDA